MTASRFEQGSGNQTGPELGKTTKNRGALGVAPVIAFPGLVLFLSGLL
jgi:hypothetical protein